MIRTLMMVASLCAALPAAAQQAPAPTAPATSGFTDYTGAFDTFARQSEGMSPDARTPAFRARFGTLWPGYYNPRGAKEEWYDARVAKALAEYPAIRDRFLAVSAAFASNFASAGPRFSAFFPDFEMSVPVYLVHSLGEMDGGTRMIDGQRVLIFGADVIAQLHDASTVGALFDHELFHVYHEPRFACDPVWCVAWEEGLATYATSQINPGATDRQLLLTIPVPLRETVDAQFDDAMCALRDRLDSVNAADYAAFFRLGSDSGPFPNRFGYYLGFRIAQRLGEAHSLSEMAHWSPEEARPLIEGAIAELARCPS